MRRIAMLISACYFPLAGCSSSTTAPPLAPVGSGATAQRAPESTLDSDLANLRAVIRKRESNDQARIDEASALIQSKPSAEAYLDRARLLRNAKQTGKAIKDLDEAIRKDPNSALAYSMRARCRLDLKDTEQAKIDCDKAMSIDSKSAHVLATRSWLRLRTQDVAGAVEDATAAIRLDSVNADGYVARAKAHQAKKEIDAAIQDFDDAIRCDGGRAPLYTARGSIFVEKKLFERAATDLQRAIELDPRESLAHFFLGLRPLVPSDSLTRIDKCIVHLKIAIELGGLASDAVLQAREQLSYAYQYRGIYLDADADLAIKDWLKSVEYDPENPNSHALLGHAYLVQGRGGEALHHLNLAIASGHLSGPGLDAAIKARNSIQGK